jgi:hypothetical protein
MAAVIDTAGERVAEVRMAQLPDRRKPMTVRQFAELLTARAQAMGIERRYDGGAISRIETNQRPLTPTDIAVIASVDPLRRGRLWLGWGEDALEEQCTPSRLDPDNVLCAPPADVVTEVYDYLAECAENGVDFADLRKRERDLLGQSALLLIASAEHVAVTPTWVAQEVRELIAVYRTFDGQGKMRGRLRPRRPPGGASPAAAPPAEETTADPPQQRGATRRPAVG